MDVDEVAALIEDARYHSPDCTDRVTSHTWESSGKACGTAAEISMAPGFLRERWVQDRTTELARRRPTADELLRFLQAQIHAHEPDGYVQWFVDEHCIDCDAEEFWKVLRQALAAKVRGWAA